VLEPKKKKNRLKQGDNAQEDLTPKFGHPTGSHLTLSEFRNPPNFVRFVTSERRECLGSNCRVGLPVHCKSPGNLKPKYISQHGGAAEYLTTADAVLVLHRLQDKIQQDDSDGQEGKAMDDCRAAFFDRTEGGEGHLMTGIIQHHVLRQIQIGNDQERYIGFLTAPGAT